ncbi:hypothetical protein KO505_13130 [Psychrosphaera sp. F3M07]|uniref:hypothetical protein n=1 Tax=Psychrosphaera sp. F3M07 TaxID=2841560 RepID=UPI001C09D57C|nr:hypothetical protein [Psychrosphaera sp. F3M07]MBU2918892.1 hypothetical protein [Psychrosphaera sp. F3M07]
MRRNTIMTSVIFAEIFTAILLGGVPALIILYVTGIPSLFSFLENIMPIPEVLYYFLGLAVLQFLVRCAKHYWFKPTDQIENIVTTLDYLLFKVGAALKGVYRTFFGAMLVILPPIIFVDFSFNLLLVGFFVLFFALMALIQCSIYSTSFAKR